MTVVRSSSLTPIRQPSMPSSQPQRSSAAPAAPQGWVAQRAPLLPGFGNEARSMSAIAAAVRSGQIDPSTVEAQLHAIPTPSKAEVGALWTPAGARTRHELMAAYSQLAAVAPNARLDPNPVNGYRPTVREAGMHFQFTKAMAEQNPAARQFAADFLQTFPNSPSALGIRNIASRLPG